MHDDAYEFVGGGNVKLARRWDCTIGATGFAHAGRHVADDLALQGIEMYEGVMLEVLPLALA